MEHEERKIAKVYAIISLYTIGLLIAGILLGFAMGRDSVLPVRERIYLSIQPHHTDTLKVERFVPFH